MTHIKPGSRTPHHDPTTHVRIGESWTEQRADGGVIWERLVMATAWREVERTDCYCCTCPEHSIDPYCRNHGGHHGLRPCERHGMPGQLNDAGEMPLSVQAYRLGVCPACGERLGHPATRCTEPGPETGLVGWCATQSREVIYPKG